MKSFYPLSQRDDRELPADYSGRVYVWDIDKTYLSTRFSSLQGLLRIPVEFAVDKQAIPGMPEVLRGLRRGPRKEDGGCIPLYFISASPPFLRSVLERKMLLDGVEQDGIILKDWFRLLWPFSPSRFFDQLGFKIAALLCGRIRRIFSQEYLFGDDYERDAEAYSLYAHWVNGDLSLSSLGEALKRGGVSQEDRENLLHEAEALPRKRGRVKKIYIHLEKKTPPRDFGKYGKILVPVKGAYQLALALFDGDLIDAQTLKACRKAVCRIPGYRFGQWKGLTEDAVARKLIRKSKVNKVVKS